MVWGVQFGQLGSLNDINPLGTSSLITRILYGTIISLFEYALNGKKCIGLYFLVDGIYLHWAIFVSTITERATRKQGMFSAVQEGF